MEKFAGYGFNKSHSAAYALLSYQTAWLKAHYPAEFMAAVLSSDMDNTDKVVTLIDEARRMQLEGRAAGRQRSHYMFTVSGERSIRYGLGAIKGVGQSVRRDAGRGSASTQGAFRDLADLCRRIDSEPHQSPRARSADPLRRARPDRREPRDADARAAVSDAAGRPDDPRARRRPERHVRPDGQTPAAPDRQSRSVAKCCRTGAAACGSTASATRSGLYLTGHPFEEFEHEVRPIISGRIADITGDRPPPSNNEGFQFRGKPATIAGMVFDLGKRGSRVIFTMDDRSGRIEASMFEDVWQQYRTLIAKSAILVVEGSLRFDEYIEGWRLTAKRAFDIDHAREQYARRLVLRWPEKADRNFIKTLEQTLKPFRGGRCAVAVRYQSSAARAELVLSEEWSVKATRELTERISQLCGNDGWRLIYAPSGNA